MTFPLHNNLINQSSRKYLHLAGLVSLSTISASVLATTAPETIETYVVTGEMSEKEIKNSTSAVTIISEDRLESGELNQAKQAAALAPNVIASSFSNISIRGISGGGAATGGLTYLTGARARIVSVVDGVTQDFSGYNFNPVTLWDVEQLEILRGPQSTAQGASAIGGALVVKTKDPTFHNEAALRGGLENYENGNVKYNLGVMSSDALIEDELAYRLVIDGSKGEGWLNYNTGNFRTPNLSESKSLNVRGKLLWQPSHAPALSAKLTVNYAKNDGEHASFASNTKKDIDSKIFSLNGSNEVRIQDSDANSIAADIDYKISKGLKNALHISRSGSDIHDDAYSTGNTYDIDNKTYVVENRLIFSEDGNAPSGVLGVYYSNKDASLSTSNFDISTDFETTTSALYGEGTYPISSETRLIAGIRVENEDSDKSSSTRFSGGKSKQNENDTYFLPKISLMHDITDSTTIAASASRGYSPAGVGISFMGKEYSYDSETVTAYELSSKSVFTNGTSLNANLFYNDYEDYQAGTSSFTIANVAKSYTYGLEIEGVTWLNDNIELRGSIGLLQSKIDQDSLYKDKELTDAPNTNIALGLTHYLGENWTLGANANYVGEYYSDLNNNKSSTAGDYTLLDARASYTLGDLTLNAFVKNLTDESAVFYRAGALASVSQSRTIGISALYRM